jgi:predicted AAA+ superfamily ATPase
VDAGATVVVDEIQRLPHLLNEVHRFIEERRLRFVLCGSSARKLKQQGTNLLAGRALRSWPSEASLSPGRRPPGRRRWPRTTEVDFLLRRGREWIAIEAKSSARADADLLRGLRAIEDLAGLRRRILVHRGSRRLVTPDGIEVWPVGRFLEALETATLWP